MNNPLLFSWCRIVKSNTISATVYSPGQMLKNLRMAWIWKNKEKQKRPCVVLGNQRSAFFHNRFKEKLIGERIYLKKRSEETAYVLWNKYPNTIVQYMYMAELYPLEK